VREKEGVPEGEVDFDRGEWVTDGVAEAEKVGVGLRGRDRVGVALAVRVVTVCDWEPVRLGREAEVDSRRVALPVRVCVAVKESPCVGVGGDTVGVRDGVADVDADGETDMVSENE